MGRRQLAATHFGVCNTAAVPELAVDAPACGVDSVGNPPPARDLVLPPDARPVNDALALLGDRRAFSDDQASVGALGIIFGHQRRRHIVIAGARARHCRHPDAVLQVKAVEIHRCE